MALSDLVFEYIDGLVKEAFEQYSFGEILRSQAFIRLIGQNVYHLSQMDMLKVDQFKDEPSEDDLLGWGIDFIYRTKQENDL